MAWKGGVTRLVIDTDPGVDDAQAIMLALAHPGARVEALTVVAGNVGFDDRFWALMRAAVEG